MMDFVTLPIDIPGILNDGDDEVCEAPQASTNPDIQQTHVNELLNLIRRKQRDAFRDYVHSIPHPDLHLDCGDCDAQRNTVMHLAVLSGDEEIVSAAIEAGGSVNKYENEEGDTPLSLAAQACPNVFVLMLHDARNPMIKRINSRGQNLLHAVVTAKATARPWPDRLLLVRELLETHNLSIKQTDNNGFTPAEWARQHFLGLGNDAAMIVELLSKSHNKRMNATRAEFVTFYKAPATRLACVCLLILLHSLQYAADTFDRPASFEKNVTVAYERFSNGSEVLLSAQADNATLVWLAFNLSTSASSSTLVFRNQTVTQHLPASLGTFPFVFLTFNMIGANWDSKTNIIAAHLACLLIGATLGLVAMLLLVREWMGKHVLCLRIFGADAGPGSGGVGGSGSGGGSQADDASSMASSLFSSGDSSAQSHGIMYAIVMGIFVGIFCGAHFFNYLLAEKFTGEGDANGAAYLMTNYVGTSNGMQILRAMWVTSILLDYFILFLVLDTMLEQLAGNLMIPDPTYSGFLSALYPNLGWWRSVWWWVLLPLGWLGILIGFGVRSQRMDVWEEPTITTSSPGGPLGAVGMSIFLDAVVLSQDWTLPYRRYTPDLPVPWLPSGLKSNMMWLLWTVMSCILAMDFRLLVGQIEVFVSSVDLGSNLRRFELAMALLPPFIAVWMLLIMVLRTSTRIGGRRVAYADDETRTQSAAAFQPQMLGRSANRAAAAAHATAAGGAGPASPMGAGGGDDGAHRPTSTGFGGGSGGLKRTPMKSNRVVDADAPARPPSNAGKKTVANDIWTAAAADDVIKLCTLLEKDPTLINARGGPGLECDAAARTVTIIPPSARAGAEYGAAPIHYAIAAGARATLTALMSRGANLRLRTLNGMFSCRELAEMINNAEFKALFSQQSAVPAAAAGGAAGGGQMNAAPGVINNSSSNNQGGSRPRQSIAH